MGYIASGFYYHVYQTSPTRVKKIPTSSLRKAWLLLWWGMTPLSHWLQEVKNIDPWFANELRMTRALIATFPQPDLLGNPSPIAPDGSYEQDYARSLGHSIGLTKPFASNPTSRTNSTDKKIGHISSEQWEKYVREYCRIQHQLWQYGFGERIWNFTFNCGVDPVTGRMVLIDLNELTQDKEVMRAHIRNTKWQTQNSLELLQRHNPHFAGIAENVLREMCTEKILDNLWCDIAYYRTMYTKARVRKLSTLSRQ